MPPDAPPPKHKIREQLNAAIEAFLRKGGNITQVDPGQTNRKATRYGANNVARNFGKEVDDLADQ